ncbi:MAG: universal stress protein [Gammaproteobacteria bacterium]|nr:universal stress protein [Gammaproteobacteria bacterium]MBT8151891.1 universal stress protein [Gammaproteobacteria bacterium]NND40233.1 universal stress protein [Pseudomonadales bacterium]NNM12461.1 universal stress protein [Pseudomonadales bacterium]RZV51613.1 MAG: universal stress protein [Pseudomonadales bacterium]
MSEYKKVLVALDVCEDNNDIIARAARLAGDAASLRLLHMVEPIYYPENYMGGLSIDLQEKSIEFARQELHDAAKKYGIPDSNCHVNVGKASSGVHTFAKERDCDLVVIGSHGKHGLQLLLGSTATAILHGASCDVLAVRIVD